MEPFPRYLHPRPLDFFVTTETRPVIGSSLRTTTSNATGVTVDPLAGTAVNDTFSPWVFGQVQDTVIVPTLMAMLLIWAITTNLFFIFAVLSHKQTRSGFNIMLVNIAVCDIFFALVSTTTAIGNHAKYASSFDDDTNDDVICKVVHYFMFVSVYVVVYTLTVVTVFRFFGEYMSGKGKSVSYLTCGNAILSSLVIWVAFLVSHASFFLQKDVGIFREPFVCLKSDSLMEPTKVRMLWITFLVCAFIMPLVAVSLMSIFILHVQSKEKPAAIRLEVTGRLNYYVQTQVRAPPEMKQKRQQTVLIMAALVLRAASWVPVQVFVMADAFGFSESELLYRRAEMVSFCVALLACCVTPMLHQCAVKEIHYAVQESLIRIGCACCVTVSEEELSDMNETIMSIISDSSNHINYAESSNQINYP